MDVGGTIPRKESVESSREQRPRITSGTVIETTVIFATTKEMSSSVLKRDDFLYQPYYCEENIWHLCQHAQFKDGYIIFVASTGDSFPMLNQRVMSDPSIPILWDYHVILLLRAETNQILDFDTILPFGVTVDTYLKHSFLDNRLLAPAETPLFRVLPASEYIASFSSDRSHMKVEEDWIAPPPDWPCIGRSDSNLHRYIDMINSDVGEVLGYDALLQRFS